MNRIPEIHEVEIKMDSILKIIEDKLNVKRMPGLIVSKRRSFLNFYLPEINIGFEGP